MFPVQDKFLQAIRQAHHPIYKVDVWFAGSFIKTVDIISGSVTIDRTSDTRRSCKVTLADSSLIPSYVNSPIAPYGAELYLYAGLQYPDSTQELCAMGVFRIQDVDWDEATGSLPEIQGYDRSKALIDASFLAPRDRSGQSAMATIELFAQEVVSCDVNFDSDLVDITLPGGSIYEDRWDAITTIAAALGAEAFFDVYGNLAVDAVPALTQDMTPDDANWTIDTGPNGVLVQAQRGVSRTGVYNAVVIQGSSTSSTGTPPVGYAVDSDPRSPTYWGPATAVPNGPFAPTNFGQVTKKLNNPALTTVAACNIAAQAELNNSLGAAKSLAFSCAPNYALDAGDVVYVKYLNGQSELHLVDSLNVPFGSGSFGGNTRSLTYQTRGGS